MLKIIKDNKKIVYVTILILLSLSILKKVYVFEFKYKEESNVKLRCMVIEKKKEDEDKVSYLVKCDNNSFLLNIYDYNEKDLRYSYGDILEFRGKINKIEKLNNPYEFDYKKYLNSNNIVSTISSYNGVKYVTSTKGNILLKICYEIKDIIFKKIDNNLTIENANLYKSMIYGQSENLDEDIKETFKKNGLSHMLAVSGLHLTYLVAIVDIVLKNENNRKYKIIYYFIIIFYILISGMSISSIRAGIMAMLVISKNNSNKYVNIAISYILLLIYNPYMIFSVSSIMTYLATISIILFNSLIYSFFEVILKVPNCTKSIFKILSTTISSLILLFPVQIYYFGLIELRLFLSIIFTNFFNSFVYIVSFITFFLMFVPGISNMLFNSLNIMLHLYIKYLDLISMINLKTIYLPKPSLIELYLYYISIFLLCIKKYIVLIRNKELKKYFRKCIVIFCVFSFCIIFAFGIYRIYFEEYIVYFNVGQGNMSLIRKNRKVIIVDTGSTSKNVASNALNSFLQAKGINKIDLVLLTHMHEDHINGIYNIKAKIEKIGYSLPKKNTEEYEEILKFIEQNDISKLELKKGDNISLKDINIDILLPFNDKTINSTDIANSNSMVILITILGKKNSQKFLFMGDATIETEEELIKTNKAKLNNIYVLQLGHHGSKTSTSVKFLNNITVKFAVISSKKKVYGHPAKETLDKLEKYNITYHITENKGAMFIKL